MKTLTNTLIIAFLASLYACSPALAGELDYSYTVITERNSVHPTSEKVTITDGDILSNPGAPALGYKTVKLSLPPGTKVTDLEVEVSQPEIIRMGYIGFARGDLKTGNYYQDTTSFPDALIYDSDDTYPETRVKLLNSGYWGDIHIADIAVYPLAYKPLSSQLLLYREITIRFNLQTAQIENGLIPRSDPIAYEALSSRVANTMDLPRFASPGSPKFPIIAGNIPSPVYLIITSGQIAPGFYDFLDWKNQKGIPTDMVLIEDILSSTQGDDPAEQLRNYLIQAYNDGIRYVLLGGDEDVVPIRYLYPNNVNGHIPELHSQQISDLYFADLTGNWDVDGDGVWGESYNDEPDYYPELYVGRVPARTAQHAEIWGAKAVLYEKNPGNGDPSYLTKALFVCSDQMRDLGQHRVLAEMLPSNFTYDNSRLIEEPSGIDQNPTQPLAETVIEVMQEGWGFTTNLNHGDFSWYASMASGYNTSNRSGVWGDTVLWEGCGALSHLTTFDKPAVHYTISCDLAAFDFDKGVFWPGPYISPYCHMESYLFEPGSGVAFLGNTRWGWVSASYNLERKFFSHIFNDSSSNISLAETMSKLDYPSSRDLVYGHNLFGDPEMSLWRAVDGNLELVGLTMENRNRAIRELHYTVLENKQPVSQAQVCLYKAGELYEILLTDNEGRVQFTVQPETDGYIMITATKKNYIPAQLFVTVGMPMDSKDEEPVLPLKTEIYQNYPNPFNPATTIEFGLAENSSVDLKIYNINGQLVKNLLSETLPAGEHSALWFGRNDANEKVTSGVYFYKFATGTTSIVKQMTLLK
ncbi:MAG: C25 family cysteine peptidase [candidate division Zixibacteria bacterium]